MKLSAPIFRLKRQAKQIARTDGIRLHQALDRIARDQGYRSWSHLAADMSAARPAAKLIAGFEPGDLVLLAARPGHGKTRLALEMLIEATRTGKSAAFFTLDYTDADVVDRLVSLGATERERAAIRIDASDCQSVESIIAQMEQLGSGSIAAIDYLQLLDQRRDTPPVDTQLRMLQAFASQSGTTFLLISQVSRDFEASSKPFPDFADLHQPNPFSRAHFAKLCALRDGEIDLSNAM